jgi:hypothetical protein
MAPVDWNINCHPTIMPFSAHMQMRRSSIDKDWIGREANKVLDCLKKGLDPYDVADMLERWKDKHLPPQKKIVPLCYDWPFIYSFLFDWLGGETMGYLFQTKVRDVLVTANYLNDRADYKMLGLPYPKPEDFTYLAQTCEADYKKTMDIKKECLAVIKIYNHQLKQV